MHSCITLHSSWDFMHAFSFDLRSSRRQRSLTAGELKENLIEEIKALYRQVNPDKKDVPQLLAYYEGQELDLYKKVCEKYGVEPKERFASILSRRSSRKRHRSTSPSRPLPSSASRPDDGDKGDDGEKGGDGGKGGDAAEGEVGANVVPAEPVPHEEPAVPVPEVSPAAKTDAPKSPLHPPKRIIPAFRPVTQTGRYWPCPSPAKYMSPTPKMHSRGVVPPPPKPPAPPLPWWPAPPPPPVPAKQAARVQGTTTLPPRPARKEMPKTPQARIIHYMHAMHVIHQSHAQVM